MSKKVKDMKNAGFVSRGGKGSHRNFVHPNVQKPITISGKEGDDAKEYQENAVRKAIKESQKMREEAKYVKIVEWSETDQCFTGSCPELFYGGCHGDNKFEVFRELCKIIKEAIQLYREDWKPLPPPMTGKELVTQLQHIT